MTIEPAPHPLAAADDPLGAPPVAQLQDGDFLFPKPPGAIVPYVTAPSGPVGVSEDQRAWEAGKEQFLQSLETQTTYLTDEEVERLRKMTYAEFRAYYATAPVAGPQMYGANVPFSVGHVAIVYLPARQDPQVVEAVQQPSNSVIRRPYRDWQADHAGDLVWQGRLAGVSADDRAKVSAEAARYVGVEYDFWNFDLNDPSGFYCSKLAWLSVYRALGFAIDNDMNPRRWLWFSPKQMLYAPHIDRLEEHGPYLLRVRAAFPPEAV